MTVGGAAASSTTRATSRRDRDDDSGWGGCLIYYKSTIHLKRMKDLESPDYKKMIASVKLESRGKLLPFLLYRPPDKDSEVIRW